jgi:hypothetical protein
VKRGNATSGRLSIVAYPSIKYYWILMRIRKAAPLDTEVLDPISASRAN